MIHFENLQLEGFGSIIERQDFDFRVDGVVLIQGKNGTGKTTILSAVFWALYGKTLKGKASPEPWDSVKPRGFKGTYVELTFITNKTRYKIIRCHKYKGEIGERGKGNSNVYLWENGKLYTEYHTKPDLNKYIGKRVAMSQDLFKASILFGQKMKRIIEETGGKQKEVFEEAFSATYISEAKQEISDELKEIRVKFVDTDHEIDKTEIEYQAKKNEYNILKKAYTDFEKNRDLELSQLKTKLRNYELDLAGEGNEQYTLEHIEEKVKKLEKEVDDYEKSILSKIQVEEINLVGFKNVIGVKTKKHAEIANQINSTTCKSCGQALPHDFDIEKLREEADHIFSELCELNIKAKETRLKIADLKDELETETDLDLKLEKWEGMLDKATKRSVNNIKMKTLIPQIKSQIDDLKAKKNEDKHSTLKPTTKALYRKLGELKELKKDLQKQIDLREWLIKDPLSNSGLKAFIIAEMLKDVNEEVKKYSGTIGFEIEIAIDKNSAKKDLYMAIFKGDEIIIYDDLSGGQQQLVNLAIAFATHDVISEDCNILFLDEVFESLDSDNISKVSELIEFKSKNKEIWVITHREQYNPMNAKMIYTELNKKGQTIISR